MRDGDYCIQQQRLSAPIRIEREIVLTAPLITLVHPPNEEVLPSGCVSALTYPSDDSVATAAGPTLAGSRNGGPEGVPRA